MRHLEAHKTNECNSQIEVLAHPAAVGGASVRYDIMGPRKECGGAGMVPSFGLNMKFQNGPIADGVNGLTNEVLLAILIDRLDGFQSGPYACEENAAAKEHLWRAREAMLSRTKARSERGVEGTHAH